MKSKPKNIKRRASAPARLDSRTLWDIRQNVLKWFQGFGKFCDEQTRRPSLGRANVLQRRMFAHYQWCREHDKPCRMVVLKYRRAGSSTASAAILYTHAQNHHARLGVIGTDYKASSNMLAMIEHFGRHDHFPGWDTKGERAETADCGNGSAGASRASNFQPAVSATQNPSPLSENPHSTCSGAVPASNQTPTPQAKHPTPDWSENPGVPQPDRVALTGLRLSGLPHHRTCGFPHPAVSPWRFNAPAGLMA